MRVALVSDVHGNRHGFEAVLDAARAEGVDEVWCLGDLVGYGADPDACVALAREHCDLVLAGNHDLAVTGALSTEDFSRGAALAAHWTQEHIDPDALAYLKRLLPQDQRQGIGLFHASPRDPVWEYVLSALQAELCMDATDHQVSVVGHSHVALSFERRAGEPAIGRQRRAGEQIAFGEGTEWLLNPGSAGQPRDGDPRAAWLLVEVGDEGPAAGGLAQWRREPYDVQGAQAAIREAGLPGSLADRLARGQ